MTTDLQKSKKVRKQSTLIKLLLLFLLIIIGLFAAYSYNNFKLHLNFSPLPLVYDPQDNTSIYNWDGIDVKVRGGFIKGKFAEKNGESLLIRALSPEPVITVAQKTGSKKACLIRLENVKLQDVLAQKPNGMTVKAVDPHTVLYTVPVKQGKTEVISVKPRNKSEYFEFVILGDNRNGYQTFANIISQINFINPAFVIDNGDLVFGGEPNKYRLFNEIVSKLQVPLFTTLGNHDIRENGRPIYTMLFGPPYYSFDYQGIHFIYLDSSRGWAEQQAIPNEQYRWLENDLKKAAGKRVFVITHIPPTDPRSSKQPNYLTGVPGISQTNYFEKLMNDYTAYKNLNHGFPSKKEAARFESLMSKYKVDTVYLSHIHSYFSYVKGGVRYIISGGAGAELLTENSYYHYIRVKVTNQNEYLEVVELPSPANQIQDRYIAAFTLFANSIYKEYTPVVWGIGLLAAVIIAWLLIITRTRWVPWITTLAIWLKAVFRFAIVKYREMKRQRRS